MDAVRIQRTTLACVDCVQPQVALRAIAESLRRCEFTAAKFFTDAANVPDLLPPGVECVVIPPLASAADYSRFMMKELVHHIATDFVQVVQWDGYVTNAAAWSDEFLAYDYIGARWWFHGEGRNVGNGGFSLRSRRLLEALQDPHIVIADPEDEAICITHRDRLEGAHGIRFAPAAVADRYAFEGTARSGEEFGFHRIFNLPFFLDETALAEVLERVPDSTFATPATVTLVQFLEAMRRKREAVRYARRYRANERAYLALPPDARRFLDRSAHVADDR